MSGCVLLGEYVTDGDRDGDSEQDGDMDGDVDGDLDGDSDGDVVAAGDSVGDVFMTAPFYIAVYGICDDSLGYLDIFYLLS